MNKKVAVLQVLFPPTSEYNASTNMAGNLAVFSSSAFGEYGGLWAIKISGDL